MYLTLLHTVLLYILLNINLFHLNVKFLFEQGTSLSELSSSLFQNNAPMKSICYRCLGAVLSTVTSTDLPRKWTADMLTSVRHGNALQCQGLGLGMEAAVRKKISK